MSNVGNKRFAPAASRNLGPITDALRELLPGNGRVLEIASGTGQHAAALAAAFPRLRWQPTDFDPSALESIEAYRQDTLIDNLEQPLLLDASAEVWPVTTCDVVLCINMIHISPWEVTVGLLRGARRLLPSGAPLILYGPYRIDGDWGAESNLSFDRSLRERDPSWGVRELRDVEAEAAKHQLTLQEVRPMPANNHVVVFRKT